MNDGAAWATPTFSFTTAQSWNRVMLRRPCSLSRPGKAGPLFHSRQEKWSAGRRQGAALRRPLGGVAHPARASGETREPFGRALRLPTLHRRQQVRSTPCRLPAHRPDLTGRRMDFCTYSYNGLFVNRPGSKAPAFSYPSVSARPSWLCCAGDRHTTGKKFQSHGKYDRRRQCR